MDSPPRESKPSPRDPRVRLQDDDAIQTFAFPTLVAADGSPAAAEARDENSVRLRIVVGRCRVDRTAALQAGDTMTLDNAVDEPVEVFVDDQLIARGELVVVGDELGVKVIEHFGGTAVTESRQRRAS